MSLIAQIAALILALARALPAIERILAAVEERRASSRAAELHGAIDDAIAQARREAVVCPYSDCPLRRLRDNAAAAGTKPDGAVPQAS